MATPIPISIRAYRPSDAVDVIALRRACDWVRIGFAVDDGVNLGKRLVVD